MKEKPYEKMISYANVGILLLLTIVSVIPLLYIAVVSLISPEDYIAHGIHIPSRPSIYSYLLIFSNSSKVLRAFIINIYITVVGTIINLIFTTCTAYAISKKYLPGRVAMTAYMFVTMLFSGGLIPTFLLVKALGLVDTLWALMIPGAIAVWNVFLMRNFFYTIPDSLEESARIDGANDIVVMLKVVLPLSLPIIATMTLFYGVAHWNEWFSAMIYLNNTEKYPLQLVLREVLMSKIVPVDPLQAAEKFKRRVPPDVVRMATIMVSIVPILVSYPFLQKYFVKGILIGSIKG
jgi:putative aldouronate transport system permease protein